MSKWILVMCATLCALTNANAAVKTEVVNYEYDGTKLKGYISYDDRIEGKRPGVLVVHEWWGLDEYAKKRAVMLAEMGYVAMAVDMYGEGKLTEHPNEAREMATAVRKNIDSWMGRAKAGLKVLQSNPHVDPKKIASIGYCFGGTTSLLLAQNSSDISAVVSFHGALPMTTAEQAKSIKARVLICHGADDKFIPEEAIKKFRTAYDSAGVKYEFVAYPGAVHSFTVPDADARKIDGMKYDEKADKESWKAMSDLFKQVFATK